MNDLVILGIVVLVGAGVVSFLVFLIVRLERKPPLTKEKAEALVKLERKPPLTKEMAETLATEARMTEDPSSKITKLTLAIDSGSLSTDSLVAALFARASARRDMRDYPGAIADLTLVMDNLTSELGEYLVKRGRSHALLDRGIVKYMSNDLRGAHDDLSAVIDANVAREYVGTAYDYRGRVNLAMGHRQLAEADMAAWTKWVSDEAKDREVIAEETKEMRQNQEVIAELIRRAGVSRDKLS